MKSLGFRKEGNTWIRGSRWPQLINIQLSSSNTSDEARITMNLGVFVEELRQALGESPLKGKLKEYDCSPQVRIGRLRPDGQDHWWKVTPSTAPDALAEELFAEISGRGIPWLESLDSFEGLAREFEKEKTHFKAAVAFHLAGMPTEAGAKMSEAVASANEYFRPKLLRIARSLAIPIRA